MSTTQKDKSSGKPRQRSRKADQRGQKPEALQSPKRDQEMEDQIGSLRADVPTNGAAPPARSPDRRSRTSGGALDRRSRARGGAPDRRSCSSGCPLNRHSHARAPSSVGIQTIANAYEDYAKRSLQESRSFVEKLMGVRSFDKAIEVQTEFATLAYVNFVAELQKICELYNELARQIFRPWERFATEVSRTGHC